MMRSYLTIAFLIFSCACHQDPKGNSDTTEMILTSPDNRGNFSEIDMEISATECGETEVDFICTTHCTIEDQRVGE